MIKNSRRFGGLYNLETVKNWSLGLRGKLSHRCSVKGKARPDRTGGSLSMPGGTEVIIKHGESRHYRRCHTGESIIWQGGRALDAAPTGFANLNKLVNWTLHFALWVIERIILYYFPYILLLVSCIRSSVKLMIVEPANQTWSCLIMHHFAKSFRFTYGELNFYKDEVLWVEGSITRVHRPLRS